MASTVSTPQSPVSPISPTNASPFLDHVLDPRYSPAGNRVARGALQPSTRSSPQFRNRLSVHSQMSRFSESRTRPISFAIPIYPSSLSYALVRDFAYPSTNPYHYGPPASPFEGASIASTPASDTLSRFSDFQARHWDNPDSWSPSESTGPQQHLPSLAFGDGPPYSEDEDLHSPIVVSSRHKQQSSSRFAAGSDWPGVMPRQSSNIDDPGGRREGFEESLDSPCSSNDTENNRLHRLAQKYRLSTHAADQQRLYPSMEASESADEHYTSNSLTKLRIPGDNESRYSKDYQFTIVSPDEEMHGKAVALFDFTRENENELPLVEGQVIWVSYRHGQGWLVAQDPKTGDAGLVPEEYVRLLRDIEGGLGLLASPEDGPDLGDGRGLSSAGEDTNTDFHESPLQTWDQSQIHTHSAKSSTASAGGDRGPAVLSSFSTSSNDLNPYPHPLVGKQAGQPPPLITHYSGQTHSNLYRSPVSPSSRAMESSESELAQQLPSLSLRAAQSDVQVNESPS